MLQGESVIERVNANFKSHLNATLIQNNVFYTTVIMLIPYYLCMIFPLLLSNLTVKYHPLIKLFLMIVRQFTYNVHILLVLLLKISNIET